MKTECKTLEEMYNMITDPLVICKKQLVSKTEQLEKKLEIATKALKDYANSDEWELVDSKSVYWSRKRFPYPWRIAGKALKEMEGVK